MFSLPFFPQLARSFMLDSHCGAFRMNGSLVMFHPRDNEGNVAYLLFTPKRLDPSRRNVAWNM